MNLAAPLSSPDPDPLAGLAWLGDLFFALLAVLLLLVLVWRLFLKPRSTLVRVHARVPLETRRSLYLVEAAGVFLLIGAGEGGLSTLAELEADKVKEALKEATHAPNTLAARLLSLLPPRGGQREGGRGKREEGAEDERAMGEKAEENRGATR